jgi:chitodextrinase
MSGQGGLKSTYLFQSKKLLLLVLLSGIAGIAFIFISNAASTTQTFSSKLTTRQPTQSFTITAASGEVNATITLKDAAVPMTLSVTDQAGTTVATKSGASPLSITTPVIGGTYKLLVGSSSAVPKKGITFTLNATYPVADNVAPSMPVNLTAKAVNSSEVDLSWTASTDNTEVVGYDIYRNGTKVGTTAATIYKDAGLTASTAYSYDVKAKDAAGNASLPANVKITTPVSADTAAPTAPTGVKATVVSNYQIDLTWTAATDNVGVVSYDIYVGISLQASNITATSYSHTNLTPQTNYYYTIKAKDAAGNVSAPSAAVSATTASVTGDTEKPTAPTNFKAIVDGPTKVSLSWGASTDNVGITGYRLTRKPHYPSGSILATPGISAISYVDTSVSPNTPYSYFLEVFDAAGNSNYALINYIYTPGSANAAISSPASGATVSGIITVSGTASSTGGQVSKVEVAGSYGTYQPASGTTNWTATIDTTKIPDSTTPVVEDPTHPDPISRYIFVKVTDSTGDFKVVTVPMTVKNDTSPPTATLTSPANNTMQSGFFTISGTAADNVGVKKVVLKSGASGGAVEAIGTTSWTAKITTATGLLYGSIDVYDVNGNKSTTPFNIYSGVTNYTGTISGKTYKDLNNNVVYDSGDEVLPNHRIYLYTGTGGGQYLKNVISDASGNFSFTELQDGDYKIRYGPSDWYTLETDWAPVSGKVVGGGHPYQLVALSGSATANFGWRKVGRTPDPNGSGSMLPIASITGPSGLTAIQYDDVVTAQEIYDRTMAGKLIGEEVNFTRVTEGIRFGGGTAGMTNGSYASDGNTGRCLNAQATSGVWWPYWYGYIDDNDDEVLFHEYGHAWQVYWSCKHQDTKLTEYMRVRGVDLSDPRINTSHEWSKAEIFAEDYRQLFASHIVTPNQENDSIPRAPEVPGLKEYTMNTYRTAR